MTEFNRHPGEGRGLRANAALAGHEMPAFAGMTR